ncbi:MAG: S8 family serine peptidase [Ferruginibacter sp.]
MKFPIFLAAAIFLAGSGCKKNESQSSLVNDDDGCVQQNAVNDGDTIEGQYIVAYNTAVVAKDLSARQLADAGQRILQKHSIRSAALLNSFGGELKGFVARLSKEELTKLATDPEVSMIEQDKIISLGTCFTVVAPWLVTWNINKTGYGDGTGKVAWVIDSGIDFTHPDLTVDASRSKSFLSGITSAADENGHGTHVAGIIGAKNNNIGVLGVASGATLISLRVLDKDGKGTLSAIIQALAWVSDNGKAGDAVNLSLGEDGVSNILDQQVQKTAAKGIFISIAAGNDGKPASQFSPARVNGKNIYTVSAVDSTGRFASFSNYGNDVVDYAAPGVKILSTYLNGKYATMSGTSMAAPHVAGLLLLKGNNLTISGSAINDPDGTADGIAHN